MKSGLRNSATLVFLLICCASLKAQDSLNVPEVPKITNIIKFNPLSILWGPIPLTAEYRILREIPIDGNQGVQVGISYLGKNPFVALAEAANNQQNQNYSYNYPNQKLSTSGYRIQLSYRVYLGNDLAPKGPYFGPMISYSEAYFSTKYARGYQNYVRASHFNINMLVGYQLVLWDKVAADLFAGLGYKKNRWDENSNNGIYQNINVFNDIPFYSWPIKFTLGINFGVAFE